MTIFANDIQTLCKMAGYFDGEGCVLVRLDNRRSSCGTGEWKLQLVSGDADNISLFLPYAGNSKMRQVKRTERARVQCYSLTITGRNFLNIALELEQHTIAKRAQISYAIDSYCNYLELRKKNERHAAYEIAKKAHAHLQELKRHNYYGN